MIYDYVSTEKYSIYDYVSTEKHSNYDYVSTEKQKPALPIACVALVGPAETNGEKEKLVSATYTERQLHHAAIPEMHNGIQRIKLQALHASVKLWDLTIHFNNGSKQTVALPGIIYQNSESPSIDLKEEDGIKTITFSLNAVTFGENAPVIWIWGW